MEPQPASAPVERLSLRLVDALMRGEGMNDLVRRLLTVVGTEIGCDRMALHDYDELTDTFDLLYFLGYPADARSDLRRALPTLDPRRALTERTPYTTDPAGR